MNLLWHILRKDLPRFRLPLAIWSVLQLIAQVGPHVVWSLPSLTADQIRFAIYCLTAVHALSWLTAFHFGICLFQEDSTAQTNAFWRTRPISGLRLLVTKLLAVPLFTVLTALPALLFAPVVSSNPLASAYAVFQFTVATHLVLASLGVPFAAVTRNYRQALLLSIVITGVFVAAVGAAHVIYDPAGTDLYQPRTTLAALIGLITVVGVLLSQYTAGRLARSLRIAGAGLITATLILILWPWRFPIIQPALPSASDEPSETRALTLQYNSSHLWNEAEFGPRSLRPQLNMTFTVSGFPPGHFLSRQAIYHHWQENTAPSFRRKHSHLSPDVDARLILGLLPAPPAVSSINTQSQIPEKFAARLRSNTPPPPYRVDMVFSLHRAEITEIPLRVGQPVSTPDGELRLLQIDPQTATLRLLIRRTAAVKTLRDIWADDEQFVLYNPRTGEALRGSTESFSVSSIQQHELSFAPITSAHVVSRAKPLTDDFLRDARLVKLSFPVVGTFARTIAVPTLQPRVHR